MLSANTTLDPTHRDDEFSTCFEHDVNYGLLEFKEALFYTCYVSSGGLGEPYPNGTIGSFRISQNTAYRNAPQESFIIEIDTTMRRFTVNLLVDLYTDTHNYRVTTRMSVQQGKQIINKVTPFLLQGCPPEVLNIETSDLPSDPAERDRQWTLLTPLTCINANATQWGEIIRAASAWIALVDTDQFRLYNLSSGAAPDASRDYVSGDNLTFLRRRINFAPFVPLCFVVAALILLRAIVRILTTNDVHRGVEMILKQNLRVKSCDSMLQDGRKVFYADLLEVSEREEFFPPALPPARKLAFPFSTIDRNVNK